MRKNPFVIAAVAAVLAACRASAVTPIPAVQGDGAASPVDGDTVTVEGIVTGDFQDGDADASADLGGFFLQGEADGEAATSDGVFVFDGEHPVTDVAAGDRVRVTGTVTEHFGETQIAAEAVRVTGTGTAVPVTLELPVRATVANAYGAPVADLERYEGMLVRLPQTLTVTEVRELEAYGTLALAAGGRAWTFTNRERPDAAGYAGYRERVAAARLLLDDGRRTAYARPIRYLASRDTLRIGDRVTGLVGVLRYSRGAGARGSEGFRLVPTAAPVFESANPRPPAPSVPGTIRVATFNVLNFFTTLDAGRDVCGPSGDLGCRGANSAGEFDRQLAKTVTSVGLLDADVVGLIELENGSGAPLERLVDALNGQAGAGRWDYVDTGAIGTDAIRTGLLYRPDTVAPVGGFAVLDAGVDARFDDTRNRPVPAQTFEVKASGAKLTIAVVHLKSKGSDCDDAGDPDTGDGQGNCSRTRREAARALADWLATDPTGSGDADVLIVGDFNAYPLEDPLAALEDAGYTNLVRSRIGPEAYSFAFDGLAGALDHAFASPSLLPRVAGVAEWHINADEPPVFDYNLDNGRDPALFDPDAPYRTSDHDPLIVGLDLAP